MSADEPTCGCCGVYRHLHPTTRCEKPRRSYWWNRHGPARHVAGLLWLALPERWRWAIVTRINNRHPNLCWCDLVDCALIVVKSDYRKPWGCSCDVLLPTDVGEPRPGYCYCPTTVQATAGGAA